MNALNVIISHGQIFRNNVHFVSAGTFKVKHIMKQKCFAEREHVKLLENYRPLLANCGLIAAFFLTGSNF